MPNKEHLSQPPFVGDLSVAETRDPELGRSVVRARLTAIADGHDILPELGDAQLLWADKDRLRLSGFERIEHAAYAQTWSIEML